MCFKMFQKIQAILVYWFDTLQQTRTFTLQKLNFFYLIFSVTPNELSLDFWKQQQVDKERLKLK